MADDGETHHFSSGPLNLAVASSRLGSPPPARPCLRLASRRRRFLVVCDSDHFRGSVCEPVALTLQQPCHVGPLMGTHPRPLRRCSSGFRQEQFREGLPRVLIAPVFPLLSRLKDNVENEFSLSPSVLPFLPCPPPALVSRAGHSLPFQGGESLAFSKILGLRRTRFSNSRPPIYVTHKPSADLPLLSLYYVIFNRQGSLGSGSSPAPQIPYAAPETALVLSSVLSSSHVAPAVRPRRCTGPSALCRADARGRVGRAFQTGVSFAFQ